MTDLNELKFVRTFLNAHGQHAAAIAVGHAIAEIEATRKRPPCPNCGGAGVIVADDDIYLGCVLCKGTGSLA